MEPHKRSLVPSNPQPAEDAAVTVAAEDDTTQTELVSRVEDLTSSAKQALLTVREETTALVALALDGNRTENR
jgi:hypothetical protein